MAFTVLGEIEWYMETDQEGHRDYTIIWLLETGNPLDGPSLAHDCPGLPVAGTPWSFGNDIDNFALCWPIKKVRPRVTKSPNYWFEVEQFFSTRPTPYPTGHEVTHPFTMPPKIRGSFTKYTEEAYRDKNDKIITNSAWERLSGKEVEFDKGTPAVSITINEIALTVSDYSEYMDCVNDRNLWGWGPRMVKFSNVTFDVLYYGESPIKVVTMDFDISVRLDNQGNKYSGFDKKVLDIGSRVLGNGGNKNKPGDFVMHRTVGDREKSLTILKDGEPWNPADANSEDPGFRDIIYYKEKNLFDLGIPVSIDT